MKFTSLNTTLSAVAILISTNVFAGQTYYEPPTVSIPAGEFYMGSDRGRDNEKPVRKVSVPAFQMAKYEVTLAEYRKFIEDTNYQSGKECMHRIGSRWFGSGEKDGDWQNNIYAENEFHPVVCISRTDAVNYTKWLSEKSGKNYRLPTEAEWEYAARAGTQTRYAYGDEKDSSKACKFGNVSDLHANQLSGKLYDAPYGSNYTIQPCNDGEVIISVVGLYQPNQFGVYDMIGNVVERLEDCYQENYENAPVDGSAVTKENCDTYVARGGSWHWEAFTSSQRMRMSETFLAALEGFRIVLDTKGQAKPAQKGTKQFVNKLKKAQKASRLLHAKAPTYPATPTELEVIKASKKLVKLRWKNNNDGVTTHYQIERIDPIKNQKQVLATTKQPWFNDKTPLPYNARYIVTAFNNDASSIASNIVDSGYSTHLPLPGKIEGEAFVAGEKVNVRNSVQEPEHDKTFSSIGENAASYAVSVKKAGNYNLDLRLFSADEPMQVEVWLGDRLLTSEKVDKPTGWHTIKGLSVELPTGDHHLTIKGTQSRFSLNWFEVKAS